MPEGGRTVILGGGFGGLITALRLAKQAPDNEVVVIDKNDVHVYTPWLYEVATGFLVHMKKSQLNALTRTAGYKFSEIKRLSGLENLIFKRDEVTGCDFRTKHALLSDGKTLRYDQLVIALGSQTASYGIPGCMEYGLQMKALDDALKIQNELHAIFQESKFRHRTFTIVVGGGGFTGTETAGELAHFFQVCQKAGVCPQGAIRIVLLEASADILSQLPKIIRYWAYKRLHTLNVDVLQNTVIAEVKKKSVIVEPRKKSENEIYPPESPINKKTEIVADLFIWAGGIKPNSMLKDFALPKDQRGRLKINPTMQVEGHPDVFALGDVVALRNEQKDYLVPPTADATIRQAKLLANNLARYQKSKPPRSFRFPSVWPAVIPIGGQFALATVKGLSLKGRLVFYLRRLVDLKYLMMIFPFFHAYKIWRKGVAMFELND
ncbi:MAG: FAD-dependent oxidoreductase [Patescibacteria group bacterium]